MFGFGRKIESARKRIEPVIGNITDGETGWSSDQVKMFEIFGDPQTASGAVVNSRTAMRVSAVYACVSLIAGSIAQLPLPVFRRVDGVRERVEHPYWWILNEEFCDGWSAAAAWEYLLTTMLLHGDGYAYIQRNRRAEMVGLIPWRHSGVSVDCQPRTSPRDPPRLQYTFSDSDGYFTVDQADVLHVPGFGFDGICSMSVIQWGARNSTGIAIQGDDHAGRFIGGGGKPEIAIRASARMSQSQQEDFRTAWVAKYGTGQRNRQIPLLLTEGLDVKELTMSAVDQQLLESRQWQVIDIARAFGVPPHMIGETTKATSWGSGIEQMGIGFVKYTLGPHLRRIKDELNRKLWTRSTYFTEHNVDSLMAGDSAAQATYFSKALGGPGSQGWMNVNEVRRLKNLPPMDGWNDIVKAGTKPVENQDEASTEAAATRA